MSGPSGPVFPNSEHSSDRSSGRQQPELRYLAIGKIVRAHGLRGEVSVAVLTEFPERFDTTEQVYIGGPYEATIYGLQSYRWHKKNVLLTLEGVTDRTTAEQLRGQFVQVPLEEAMPLPEGVYYQYQLVGLEVISTTGESLGEIIEVLETGANDVYVVRRQEQELLIPAIADVVKTIDLEKGRMVIELIDGLI